MRDLLANAASRAAAYWEGLDERGVSPTPDAVARLKELGGPLPDGPEDPARTLALLDEIVSPATVATAGPRFFGFVIGGTVPAALAASTLANAWDQNAFSRASSPAAAGIEDAALAWTVDVLRLPRGTGGGFVTGATMGNFTCLAAARHHLLDRAGWDVESKGLFGAPEVRVVVGEEVHPSLLLGLAYLGFGRDRVEKVPVDDQGRMRADRLPALDERTIVCAQAGNVNTGAFDPLDDITRAAADAGAWVHVDGAFGLWAAAAPARRHLLAGHERADSWATDAHKWLNVPYDSGLALTRHPKAMARAMSGVPAAYLPESEAREPHRFTPEMSRRARGVEVWAALRSLGRTGVADLVERNCRFATRFADGLRDAGFGVLNDVVLNQVLVDFGGDEKTRRVVAAVQEDGTCWVGPTVWQGRTAMRISVSSWRTTEDDVDRSLAAMVGAAAG